MKKNVAEKAVVLRKVEILAELRQVQGGAATGAGDTTGTVRGIGGGGVVCW